MNMKKLLKKYQSIPMQAKASFWFAICSFIQRALSLITTPIFTRLLSTADYGILGVYSTWENMILIIASLNLAAGVYLRGLIKYEDDQDEFTGSIQSLFVLVMTIVFGVYLFFSNLWNKVLDLPTSYMCLMFLDMYMVTAFQFWSARQRVDFKYRNLVVVTLLNAVLKPVLGIIVVSHTDSKIFARILVYVLCDVAIFGIFFLKIFVKKGVKFSTKYWKYALSYNLPLVPHYLSQIVLNQSDRVMIKSMVDADRAGIYTLAYTAATVLLIVNNSVLNTYNPWMYKKIKAAQYKDINSVSIGLLIMIAGLNLMLIALAPEAISILAPKAYYEAIWVIPPVSSSVFFMFLYSLFSNFEFYYEKTKLMMVASVSGAVLNIALNYVFIKLFGYMAAGYTTLFCYLCYCVFHYFVMRSILKKRLNGMSIYDMKKIMLISIGFMAIAGINMILYKLIYVRYAMLLIVLVLCVIFRKKLVLFSKRMFNFKNS